MKVIVDNKDYSLQEDKRILIPFVETYRRKSNYVHKIGLVNKTGEIIVEPSYDVIIGDSYTDEDLLVLGKYYQEEGNPHIYCNYDVYTGDGELLLGDVVDFMLSTDGKIATVFVNTEYEHGWGAINSNNVWLVSPGKYDWVSGYNKGYARVKSGMETNENKDVDVLWGVVNSEGLEVVPLEYHNIHNFYDEDYDSIKVEKDNDSITESISFGELSSIWRILNARARKAKEDREREAEVIRQRIMEQEDERYWETGAKHSRYGGVFSDDAISDAFDGDPSACWNAD